MATTTRTKSKSKTSSRVKKESNDTNCDSNVSEAESGTTAGIKNTKSKKYWSRDMMDGELGNFLDQRRVGKKDPFTHTSLVPPGKYYIDEDSTENFLTYYCNAVAAGVRLTITEKPEAYGPCRVDFDLKSDLDVGTERQYTEATITSIVYMYQKEIRNMIPEDEFENSMLWCIFLEKSAPRIVEGRIKDGFHIHFPNFICEGWVMDEYLRSRVTSSMISEKIWEGCRYTDPVDKFIDFGMARKPWYMYGSGKSLTAEPYMFSCAYDENCQPMDINLVFEHSMFNRKKSVTYYLPRFMSIRMDKDNILTPIKESITIKRMNTKTPRKKKIAVVGKKPREEVLADIKMIVDGEIMDMLSEDRADDYASWMDVGWTLFNIGQGCEEALALWTEFSRKSSKFVEGECEEQWATMTMRDKTIASLLAMAKADSPELYNEWKNTNVNGWLYKSVSSLKPNEWDVSRVVHCLYKDRFVCADSRSNTWFEYQDHRWRKSDDAVTLRKLLAENMVTVYYDYKSELCKKAGQEKGNGNEDTSWAKKEKTCGAIIEALRTCAFQEKVLRMCKTMFHNPEFHKKINENTMVLGCENGVLDLDLQTFRDGRPDDYITYSCGLNYTKYTGDDDDVQELLSFLKKVFPNEHRRNYFLDVACSCLQGGNVNKLFVIHTGEGDNAKSVTFNILETVFGEYCIKFPREMFILGHGNSSGAARPELSRVRGRRLAVVQEIAKTETINIGVLKELTGNDSFFARGLWEGGGDIKPMFTLMMPCNEMPKVPGHDAATWNRIRVLDYECRFVKPADIQKYPVPESEEEQFKMKRFKADVDFVKKIPDIASALLWYLFERFKVYRKRGLIEPPEVRAATESYHALNDVFLQFMKDRIEETDEEGAFLPVADLHTEFNQWYAENYSSYSKDRHNRASLVYEFNKRFRKHPEQQGRVKGWTGYRILMEKDDPTTARTRKLDDLLSDEPQKVAPKKSKSKK